MVPEDLTVAPATWSHNESSIRLVREEVFVAEQGVPQDLEIDGLDPECSHVLAIRNGEPIGTARMQTDGHIGRVAVLAPYRRRGIGRLLVNELIAAARQRGLREVYLHSQTTAAEFYRKLGFAAFGPEFMEADIPHVAMRLGVSGTTER